MICHNPYSNCTHARMYYYDFLSEQTRESIPESTRDHIAQCCDCQAEIDRLEMMLARVDQPTEREQSWKDSAVSTLLKLHLTYIGYPVKCYMVKPFLAGLADPALQIRIPTPITRHIEKCRTCSDALTNVRKLHLTHTQLCRLGRLLADEPAESTVKCSEARESVPAIASMDFQQTNAEILKHVCICPDCRRQVYLRREANRQKLLASKTPRDNFSCEAVCASDIYDCTFPYGLDPADDRYAEFRKPLVEHIQTCPTCLSKIQELHRLVSSIAEQPDSGVVTVYQLDKPVQTQPLINPSEIAAGVPARNEENTKDVTRTIDFTARPKRTVSVMNRKNLLRTSLAAAAVILIGLALTLNTPKAKAVTLGTVYGAVEKAKSVYNAYLDGRNAKLLSEQWVSDRLKIKLYRKESQWILYDTSTGIEKRKDLNTGISEEVKIDRYDLADLKESMNRKLEFMPFSKQTDVPAGAQWNKVDDVAVQSKVPGTEVYDLTWTKTVRKSSVHYIWRAFIDPQTNLPLRTELYQRREVETEYRPVGVNQIKYVTDAEIEAVIEGISF